ncbi:MAG: TolB family protein [Nitrososphaerales archaeon]
MFLLRRVPVVAVVLLLAVWLGAADPVRSDGPSGSNTVLLPLIMRPDPVSLSDITALVYSDCSYYMFSCPIDSDIYTVRADGSHLTRLTDNDVNDTAPSWSPDGAYILWRAGYDVWLMRSDGSDQRELSGLPGSEWGYWSPRGQNILILEYDGSAPQGQQEALFVTTVAVSTLTPVARGDIRFCGWSPSGDVFGFVKDSRLYTARADGSGVEQVASDVRDCGLWSPDGAWLAYEKRTREDPDVYVSRPDRSDTVALAAGPSADHLAAWVEGGARVLIGDGDALRLVSPRDGAMATLAVAAAGHRLWAIGVSPDGEDVVYEDNTILTGPGQEVELKLQKTNSLTPTTISPILRCSGLLCALHFSGWSYDRRQVAYWMVDAFLPYHGNVTPYVADVGAGSASYRQLDTPGASLTWLPSTSWLSGYTYGGGLPSWQLFNPRTGAARTMPELADGYKSSLIVTEWRDWPDAPQ